MAPAKSDQNSSNQPATPPQYQTDQGPTPWANDTEHDKQPMEQEISVAIVRPWYTIVPITDQIRAEHERVLSEDEPLPDDDVDDFADEPLPTPYAPKSSTVYDWAKPEAWIQEKDGEGRTVWRNQITARVRYSRPEGFIDQDRKRSVAERHETTDPANHGSEGFIRK